MRPARNRDPPCTSGCPRDPSTQPRGAPAGGRGGDCGCRPQTSAALWPIAAGVSSARGRLFTRLSGGYMGRPRTTLVVYGSRHRLLATATAGDEGGGGPKKL